MRMSPGQKGVVLRVKWQTRDVWSLSATSDEETAFSYDDEKHGLFTYFFLKGLQEKKGNLSLGNLADYITKHVSEQSILINGNRQTPTVIVSDNMQDSWRKMKLTGKDW